MKELVFFSNKDLSKADVVTNSRKIAEWSGHEHKDIVALINRNKSKSLVIKDIRKHSIGKKALKVI